MKVLGLIHGFRDALKIASTKRHPVSLKTFFLFRKLRTAQVL